MMADENWVTVGPVSELCEGAVLGVSVGESDIAIYCVGGKLYATDNVCTHAYARLSDGFLDGHEIECPLHFGRFDVRTGKGLCAPIVSDVRTYPVRVKAQDMQVLVADATARG